MNKKILVFLLTTITVIALIIMIKVTTKCEECEKCKKCDICEKYEKINLECTYTQTFKYIEDYEYKGATNKERFIVVERFQEFIPSILMINDENILKDKLITNNFYEITFVKDVISGKYSIKEIKGTDKLGLDQTQETCIVKEEEK